MRSKEASAFSVESAFVALESLTKIARPRRPTSSMRCGRPGKVERPARIAWPETPSASATATAAAAFWALCGAAERADAGDVGEGLPAGAIDAKQGCAFGEHPLESSRSVEMRASGLPEFGTARRDGAAQRVVDPDDGEIGRGDEALLDRRVVPRSCRAGRDGPARR